jgi:hypothetical protein
VRFADDDQMVQALAAQYSNQTFGQTILPGRSRRDRPVSDAHHRREPGGEDASIGPVIIAHYVDRRRAQSTPRRPPQRNVEAETDSRLEADAAT